MSPDGERDCALCGAACPPRPVDDKGRPKGRRRLYCSTKCAVAASRVRRGAGDRVPPVDRTGETFGSYLVLNRAGRRGNSLLWRVRCAVCGYECTRDDRNVRASAGAGCEECRSSDAARMPGAQRGVCSWCGDQALSLTRGHSNSSAGHAHECGKCNRRATRNGRMANGRPLYKSGGPNPKRPCAICEQPVGEGRYRFCSDGCYRARSNASRTARYHAERSA